MIHKTVLISLCLLTAAQGSATAASALQSAAEPNYPPFSMATPDGVAYGFSIDMLKAVTETMGLDIAIKTAPWGQIKNELAVGELDVLPLVGRTPEREALFDFTFPYLTLHGALFVRNDETEIQSLNDLAGKRIAVMKGDNAEEYVLRSNLSDNIVSTTTFEDAFKMLSAGEADAVIAQKLMGVSLLKELDLQTIRVVGKPNQEFHQDFCFAVQKGNADLLAILNEGLAIINADGISRNLYQKWIGPIKYESESTRTLIYGGDHAYPPFEFLDEKGRPAGFNIDLMRALSKELGIEVSFQLLPWSEIRQKMSAGELDLSSMLYSSKRSREVRYSVPLLASSQAVFARNDSPPFRSIEDLKTCRISVQDGDLAHDFARDHGWEERLVVTASLEEALQLLEDGRVDFFLGALSQGQYQISHHGWKNLRVAESSLFVVDYCYAVPQGHEDLLNLINSGLTELKNSGKYREIYNQWLSPFDSAIEWGKIRKIFIIGIACIVFIGVLVFFWIHQLRRQVHKKTVDLRESEERFNIAADAATIGFWELDLRTEKLVWDKRMFPLYGILPDEFTGTYEAWHSGLHPEDRQRTMDEVAAAVSGKKEFNTEFRTIRPDGETRYIRVFSKVIRASDGTPLCMIGTNQDITELIVTKLALQEGKEKYRALFENAPLPYQLLNYEGCFIDINPTWLRMFGYDRDEVIGKPFSSFLHPEFVSLFETNYPALKKRGYTSDMQFKIRRKDGTYRHIQFEGSIGYLPDGLFRQTYCVLQDITERIAAEHLLLESEKRFRNAAKKSPLPVMLHADDGTVLAVSQSWTEISGYTLNDIPTTQKWAELAYGKEQKDMKGYIDTLFELDDPKNEGDYTIRTKQGELRIWEFSSAPLGRQHDGKRLVTSMAIDVTERRNIESQLASRCEELDRFNKFAVGRELRMIELKQEINTLCRELGKNLRYREDCT